MYKRIVSLALLLALLLCGCAGGQVQTQKNGIVTTTMQLSALTARLLADTGAQQQPLSCVVSEPVSCLHDYTLSVRQMQLLENCALIIESGLGLEDCMADALAATDCPCIVASQDITPLPGEESEYDPHVWLSPKNCAMMAQAVAEGLAVLYPDDAAKLQENAAAYAAEMDELQRYGEAELQDLSCRKLITFHDGFSYFAEAFGLEIAASMEVEAGSEPSAKDLEEIIRLIREEAIPAIFVEANGTADAAQLVAAETGVKIYTLDMGLSGGDAIRKNVDTVKEALG